MKKGDKVTVTPPAFKDKVGIVDRLSHDGTEVNVIFEDGDLWFKVEEVIPSEKDREFNKFLEETKERFDKYFGELGYICFMFNKTNHKGESVFISNSAENIINITEPYVNAAKIAEAKIRGKELRKLRRVK